MIFLPKCRAFYVVLEKGHGAGKKDMALEIRGMAMLKLARGNTKKHVKTCNKIKIFLPTIPISKFIYK